MKDYLIDFCTDYNCDECAYNYSYPNSYPYFCITLKILEVQSEFSYPWAWNKNIKLNNRKVAFLEGI